MQPSGSRPVARAFSSYEQQKEGGVVARKNISPEALAACILGSRYD